MIADFAQRHALISGGGTGIGRAIALSLAARGASVRIVGPNAEVLAEAAGIFPENISFTVCDIRDRDHWKKVILEEKSLDLMINNAAVSRQTDVFGQDEIWEDVFSVNFTGCLEGCRAAAKSMKGRGGHIVNISSILGRLCERQSGAYSVAKAAMDQLTRVLAVELADHGILVNAVAPGFVDTPMSRATGVNELESDWFKNQFIATGRLPLRRAAQPEEVANAVLFLASASNTYITGQVLTVDGGLTAAF